VEPLRVNSEPRPEPDPMRMVRLNSSFAHVVGTLPPTLVKVPSMMSVIEKRALYGLAKERYAGRGIIVDAGIFLGASTRRFGEGIQANADFTAIQKRWPKPIVSFERGIINPGMPAFFKRNNVNITGKPGDSFAAQVLENVKPVAKLVDLRIGDILATALDIKDPIEILFLDVLKLPEISKFAIRKFFPLLIPGVSVVVQQDYFYERLPYIKTDQEFFGDYFVYLGEVGSSALFLYTEAIPKELFVRWEAGVPSREQERLASIAMQRSVDPARRFMMGLSKVRLMHQLYGVDAAKTYLAFVKGEFPEQVAATKYDRLTESLRLVEKLCADGVSIDEF